MMEDDLFTMHDGQTKVAAELEQLCTRTKNRTFKSVEAQLLVKDSERPAERAKVSDGSENRLVASSTAAYCATLAERDDLKSRREVSMFENRCILGLAEVAAELRTKVANIGKSNTLTKSTPSRRQNKTSHCRGKAGCCA